MQCTTYTWGKRSNIHGVRARGVGGLFGVWVFVGLTNMGMACYAVTNM
jgi:hypothetical protein